MERITNDLSGVKVGDKVERFLIGSIPEPFMVLAVTAIDDQFIYCESWKFDRTFGFEVDEDIASPFEDGTVLAISLIRPIGKHGN